MAVAATKPSTIAVKHTMAPVAAPVQIMSPNTGNSRMLSNLTAPQLSQQNQLSARQSEARKQIIQRHNNEVSNLRSIFQKQNMSIAPSPEAQRSQEAQLRNMSNIHSQQLRDQDNAFGKELTDLHSSFRKQNAAAEYAGIKLSFVPNPTARTILPNTLSTVMPPSNTAPVLLGPPDVPKAIPAPSPMDLSSSITTSKVTAGIATSDIVETGTVTSATSPVFLQKLSKSLSDFWTHQLKQMRDLGTSVQQTEQDFKNHNDLPLARIKRIMKSDEDVRMISAEAPVLFAKACEMFILELTLRSWSYSENNKRRTLQKEDIREAIQRTDVFDFLVDVIH